ncbi:MAG: DUF1697 domain-containing protein [Armatimonadetes bacterium]|nr:DUF1697 domain-containing protein [Armatimonadota bacterium]
MSPCALFLRAINVGKHNRITMAELIEVIEKTRLGKASTFLQSGNVRIETKHEPEIAAGVVEHALSVYGLKEPIAVPLSWDRLKQLVDSRPFEGKVTERDRSMAIFLRNPLENHAAALGDQGDWSIVGTEPEVLYAVVRRGVPLNIDLRKLASGPIRTPATMRWWNVVEDFIEKVG